MNLISANGLEQGGIQDANGNDSNNMLNRVRTFYISVLPNTQYKIITNGTVVVRGVHQYNKDKTWIKYNPSIHQLTTDENCYFIRIPFQHSNANNNLSPEEAINEGLVTLTWDLNGSAEKPKINSQEVDINRRGQLNINMGLENFSNAGFRKQGYALANEFIEF